MKGGGGQSSLKEKKLLVNQPIRKKPSSLQPIGTQGEKKKQRISVQ